MDADSFTNLALRALAGEATADERRALAAELAAQPARREEFEQLKLTHALFFTVAPMTEAVRAQEPALPAHRLNELRTAVRRHFGPAMHRRSAATASRSWRRGLRWIFAGGATSVLGVALILIFFSNRSIEVGLYGTSLVRGDNSALTPTDIPSARIVTFDQDAPFDQWQNRSLAWYERAKIWVDNEHDQLHIMRRERLGHIITETRPLAPTNDAQREQIKQIVEELKTNSL